MSTVISKDGTSIAYTVSGQGPALILVDGAMCFRAFGPMTPLAAQLASDFTVYTYDRRGRGESGDTLPYAVDREIDDLQALVEAAGGTPFLYGISSGAVLAVAAAARIPAFRKLALYEPPLALDGAMQLGAAEYKAQLTPTLAEGRRGDAIALFMTRVGVPPEVIAGMRQSPAWPIFESVAPTLAYDDAILGDSLVPVQWASAVSIPTLVMDGGASPDYMRQAAHALADAIPNAQYRTLPGQTHEVDPAVIAPELKAFFLG